MEEFPCPQPDHRDKLGINALVEHIVTKTWLSNNVIEDTPIEEDHRLLNWRKWTQIRNTQTRHLSKMTNREPHCLAMNDTYYSGLDLEKRILERAINFKGADKEWGDPDFWKIPPSLSSKKCDKTGPLYSTPTVFDRTKGHKKKEIEVVGIPLLTASEVGEIKPCKHSTSVRWRSSKPVLQGKEEAKENLNEINPLKGSISELYVVGKAIKTEPKIVSEPIEVPKIEITQHFETPLTSDNQICLPLSLIIAGVDISPGTELLTSTWNIVFTQCETKQVYEISIPCFNDGQKVVRYRWSQIGNYKNPEIPLQFSKVLRPRFFFNKTEGTILPGQSFSIDLWFSSGIPGFFKETWQLITDPNVSPGNKLIFQLEGIASLPKIDNSWENIDIHVEKCRKTTYAHNLFEGMEASVTDKMLTSTLTYKQFLKEKTIFEYANPGLRYNPDSIGELKRMYKELSKGKWDFTIDIFYSLFEKLAEDNKREYRAKLTSIIESLQQRADVQDDYTRKYSLAYTLICGFINAMESSAIDLAIKYKVKIPTARIRSLSQMEFPVPPERERDIDFDVSLTDIKGKPDKGKSGKKPEKKTNESKKPEPKGQVKKLVKPDFIQLKDNAAEDEELEGEERESVQKMKEGDGEGVGEEGDEDEERAPQLDYKQHLYILTYEHLCNAINSLTAALDVEYHFPEDEAPGVMQIPMYKCIIK